MTEVTKIITKAIARVRAFVASPHGLSKSGLAKRASLSPNALRDMDKPDWNPTPETLDALLSTISEVQKSQKTRPTSGATRAQVAA